ncbi:superoxide dismutase [Cu-Zn] [Salmonella enterica subsp. enterica serovar Oranienburg]|nr:superoxide dismutase [Cu-Zn] [Salmonella enterica subsp. enterica serovar Oranienburg]EBV1656071.1 superoxide dismutase [Cu-Zn] [Salmonella enterica subsp. enterica serovar Oranienburg]EBW7315190.1 superoxide dismutase [Cu-Zn] [Salmonella enterica subsp. enterica serovar Oranienburg]ECF2300879.1 superoxide dismutase [Cu-Zn] [Salmonella enterica subsp. enterica serovar Oranienburg]
MKVKNTVRALAAAGFLVAGAASAALLTVPVNEALPTGQGKYLGDITVTETPYGLLFTPHLTGLTPGVHGFHVHTNPSCMPGLENGKEVPALMAGGHLDPAKTAQHLGPYNDKGHLGDLPGMVVNADGSATYAVLAPRLKSVSELRRHSLMIHAGGDNYADAPAKLGGGGARFACGVIE